MFKIFNLNKQNYFNYIISHTPNAIAYIKGNQNFPNIDGKIEFYETNAGVFVLSDIKNLPNLNNSGFFAMHIHNDDTCEQNSEGNYRDSSHFNPNNKPHPEHAGDLLNLLSNDGFAYSLFLTNRFKVNDIVGKTVMIHANPDDYRTDPNGNSGTKIACGKILTRL